MKRPNRDIDHIAFQVAHTVHERGIRDWAVIHPVVDEAREALNRSHEDGLWHREDLITAASYLIEAAFLMDQIDD